ncbi:HalOD1 output domain-containing protein [Haloarculaceae archaeon H-GB2-1]|nr:hypothetical protein [Haloarculaceae archaeon H-GB1-1]MEA5406414.1 HalOD1 output domain-containing protein [Haloarculaceae archaeon H-GB2-1]
MAESQHDLYRGCTPVVDAQYGPSSNRTPTVAVVEALATAAETDSTELDPLRESIDTAALNQLFADHHGAADANAVLSFEVERWNVFVRADGRIRVCDATQPTDPTPVFEDQPV